MIDSSKIPLHNNVPKSQYKVEPFEILIDLFWLSIGIYFSTSLCLLTHINLASFLWDIGNQCRHRSEFSVISVFNVCLNNALLKFEQK